MKSLFKLSVLSLILVFTTSACEEEICPTLEPSASALTILPLGDSRVEGGSPDYESYRYELWKLLTQNNWDIDFVGSRTDDYEYPKIEALCFDKDHEGTGGAMTNDILATLQSLNLVKEPDIVLLGIGGNDLTDGMMQAKPVVDNIKEIILALQTRNPKVIIFVEQIAPGLTSFMTPEIQTVFDSFNQQILELDNWQNNAESKVVVVNMAQGWSDDYMADEVHYNQQGAEVVASRYYQAMDANVIR